VHFWGAPIALEMRSCGLHQSDGDRKGKLTFKLHHDDGDPKGKLRLGSGA